MLYPNEQSISRGARHWRCVLLLDGNVHVHAHVPLINLAY